MVRTLEDIHTICSGDVLDVMPPAVAQAQFDIVEDSIGPGWRVVLATRLGLDQLLPENATNEDQVVISFGGLRVYQSCRSAILKLIISLAPEALSDNFRTLRVLGAIPSFRPPSGFVAQIPS